MNRKMTLSFTTKDGVKYVSFKPVFKDTGGFVPEWKRGDLFIVPHGVSIYKVTRNKIKGLRFKYKLPDRCIDTWVKQDYAEAYLRFLERVNKLTPLYKKQMRLNRKSELSDIPFIYTSKESYYTDDPTKDGKVYLCGANVPNAELIASRASEAILAQLKTLEISELDYVKR